MSHNYIVKIKKLVNLLIYVLEEKVVVTHNFHSYYFWVLLSGEPIASIANFYTCICPEVFIALMLLILAFDQNFEIELLRAINWLPNHVQNTLFDNLHFHFAFSFENFAVFAFS